MKNAAKTFTLSNCALMKEIKMRVVCGTCSVRKAEPAPANVMIAMSRFNF